jgi:hypothetical protein
VDKNGATIPAVAFKGLRKTTKYLRIADEPAEIRTKRLATTDLELYSYINPFCRFLLIYMYDNSTIGIFQNLSEESYMPPPRGGAWFGKHYFKGLTAKI